MSKKIVIGTRGEAFDLEILLRTRMLVQANSGGGKGYALRKLAEKLYPNVQLIIVDPEGEFSSLREKFDFLLVSKEGDVPADIRSASMLATKLLELRASAICDLYELGVAKHEWVRLFLTSLINAPKKLWHPVVIIIDEAHQFAPEKGQGESVASDSMANLASLGRKRGFCLIAATQRIGKFSKNVSAELQNVLIGSTFQDIDRKRAAETLGILKSEERQFSADMKVLEPGTFYALGRAISNERMVMKVAAVETTHPEAGIKYKATPAPSSKIKSVITMLKDLPAEAEKKAQTESELRKQLTEVRKELAAARKEKPKADPVNVDPLRILANMKLDEFIASMNSSLTLMHTDLQGVVKKLPLLNKELTDSAKKITTDLKKLKGSVTTVESFATPKEVKEMKKIWQDSPRGSKLTFPVAPVKKGDTFHLTETLPEGEMKTLAALIQFKEGLFGNQISVITTYKRSSRDAFVSRLTKKGYAERRGGKIFATALAVETFPNVQPLPTGEELQQYWLGILPEGERKILEHLISAYPHSILKEQIDVDLNYKRSSRDAFISRLTAKELVVTSAPGQVRANANLFDL